eukprot:Skav208928  [mRNA]  locus=scaffold787:154967:158509:- [translate_table: standard]
MLDFQVPGAIALYRAMEGCKASNVGIAMGGQALDLHGLTSELARMAVRVKLLDIAIAMTSCNDFWKNPKHHGLQADGSLLLLVGLGQHSRTGETILAPSILQMLEEELGLQAHFHPSNEAMLMIPKHELLELMQKCCQQPDTAGLCTRTNFTGAKESKGSRARPRIQNKTWDSQDDVQAESRNFWGLRPRVDESFKEDALIASQTLNWHRRETQFSGAVDDCSLASAGQGDRSNRWWDSWEAEWDEGWDWEEKWHRTADGVPTAPGEVVTGKDNPRRPKGPMWLDGRYQPVPTLNHSQLAEAIVDAQSQVDELHWQALCRRAELVAMSMTPAELLAVARCVAQRQSGQLRLMWKIATFMVERICSFTTTDLVCIAHVYSSLDAVHHGMLNVVALILASPEDERTMDAVLAVDVLKSFARAQYPLPLIVEEVRRVILNDDLETLTPHVALSALNSFSALKRLDGEMLGCLLPRAIAQVPGPESVSQICAAASWGYGQAKKFQAASTPTDSKRDSKRLNELTELTQDLELTPAWMSVSDAQEAILMTLFEQLQHCRWQQLQVLRQKVQAPKRDAFDAALGSSSGPLCVVPTLGNMASVKGDLLLAAAQLLATQHLPSHARLAEQILSAAVGSKVMLWSAHQRVQWLTVAADLAEARPSTGVMPPAALIQGILDSISALETPHLAMLSPGVSAVLPRILTEYGQSVVLTVTETLKLICQVRPELYRLRLEETYRVLHGSFKSQGILLNFDADSARAVEPSLFGLMTATLDSLPAKFKSEAVFHHKGISHVELAAWCSLLAGIPRVPRVPQVPQVVPSGSDVEVPAVPEAIWQLLALECRDSLAASGLGLEGEAEGEEGEDGEKLEKVSGAAVAKVMLDAFLKVKDTYDWEISDPESPLGIISVAIQTQWKRAIARDGELEDPMHEPAPIPSEDALCLKHVFAESGIELPADVRV